MKSNIYKREEKILRKFPIEKLPDMPKIGDEILFEGRAYRVVETRTIAEDEIQVFVVSATGDH